jgi:hypothetical protein
MIAASAFVYEVAILPLFGRRWIFRYCAIVSLFVSSWKNAKIHNKALRGPIRAFLQQADEKFCPGSI